MDRELKIIVTVVSDAAKRAVGTLDKSMKGLRGTLGRALKAFAKFGKGLFGIGKRILKVATSLKGLVAAFAALAVVQRITGYFNELSGSIDRFAKLSQETGASIEVISGIGQTIQFAGASAEDFERGIRRLSTQIGFASKGIGESEKAFNEAGVSIRNAEGNMKSTQRVLFDVAEAIRNAGSEADQSAIAARLLGEEAGPKMVNALRGGESGLRSYIQQAQLLGVVFSSDQAAAVESLNDAFARLGLSIRGTFGQVIVRVADDVQRLVDALTQLTIDNRDNIVDFFSTLVQNALRAAEALGNLLARLFSAEGRAELSAAIDATQQAISERVGVLFNRLQNVVLLGAQALAASIDFGIRTALSQVKASAKFAIDDISKNLSLAASRVADNPLLGGVLDRENMMQLSETLQEFSASFDSSFDVAAPKVGELEQSFDRLYEAVKKTSEALSGSKGVLDPLNQLSRTGPFSDALAILLDWLEKLNTSIDKTSESGEKARNVFTSLRDAGEQASRSIDKSYGSLQGVTTQTASSIQGAFSSMRGAAVGFFENIISGSLSAKEALKQFLSAMLAALIRLAAQLIVIIGLFLLLNLIPGATAFLALLDLGAVGAIAGGAGAAAGPAVGQIGGAAGPPASSGGVAPGTGPVAPGNRSNFAMSPNAGRSGSGGPVTINNNINAVDANSFQRLLQSPAGRRGVEGANSSNASTRIGGGR